MQKLLWTTLISLFVSLEGIFLYEVYDQVARHEAEINVLFEGGTDLERLSAKQSDQMALLFLRLEEHLQEKTPAKREHYNQ